MSEQIEQKESNILDICGGSLQECIYTLQDLPFWDKVILAFIVFTGVFIILRLVYGLCMFIRGH